MQRKGLLLAGLLALTGVLFAACSSPKAAPVIASELALNPTASAATAVPSLKPTAAAVPSPATEVQANPEAGPYQSQVVEGGYVTVEVQPLTLKAGLPSEFEIAMNTHSVDLSADMLQAVLLRDDTGKEYAPTRWDGPTGGGHHRSGKIEFPALSSSARSVMLVVKGIAKVPERTFKWDVE